MRIKKGLALLLALMMCFAFTACKKGNELSEDITLSGMFDSVLEKSGVSSDSMTQLETKDDLENNYLIDPADVKGFSASVARNSTESINEFVIIEAVDSDAADRIASWLQIRLDGQMGLCQSYSPEFVAILEKCKVEVNGNFVSMLICENAPEVRDHYNSFFK